MLTYLRMSLASKEWVIPAKPKPGRKPKLVGPSKEAEEDEVSFPVSIIHLFAYIEFRPERLKWTVKAAKHKTGKPEVS